MEIVTTCWRRREHIRTLCLYGAISRTCMERVMRMWADASVTFYENEMLLRRATVPEGLEELCVIFATYAGGHAYFAKRLDQARQRRRDPSATKDCPGREADGRVSPKNGPLRDQADLLAVVAPFPLIDLVICEDPDQLELSSLLAVTIGFAQIYQGTKTGIRAADTIENALMAYGQCKQNYGK